MPHRTALALAVALFATAPAFAADPKKEDKKEEKKDEPSAFFTTWSKFKPGTSVILSASGTDGKSSGDGAYVFKLVEVKEGGVLIFDIEVTSTKDGKTEKRTEKAEVKKDDFFSHLFVPPFDPKTGKPPDTVEDGTEKVKVGDTEYECKWYKIQRKSSEGEAVEAKLWLCESMPGCLVKASSQSGEVKKEFAVTAVTIKK